MAINVGSTVIKAITANNTDIYYVTIVQDGVTSDMWAKPVTITFSFPWTGYSSWSIQRTASREPTAVLNTTLASNTANSGLTDNANVTIDGYYGDTYTFINTKKSGWCYCGGKCLTNSGTLFSCGEDTFVFKETKVEKPVVTVTRSGADVIATITNPNPWECDIYALCWESEYKVVKDNWIGSDDITYKHGHLYYTSVLTTKSGIEAGKTFTATWTTNDGNHECTYAVVQVLLCPDGLKGLTRSETVEVTSGTENVANSSGGGSSSGSGFSGFGGTLAS